MTHSRPVINMRDTECHMACRLQVTCKDSEILALEIVRRQKSLELFRKVSFCSSPSSAADTSSITLTKSLP